MNADGHPTHTYIRTVVIKIHLEVQHTYTCVKILPAMIISFWAYLQKLRQHQNKTFSLRKQKEFRQMKNNAKSTESHLFLSILEFHSHQFTRQSHQKE